MSSHNILPELHNAPFKGVGDPGDGETIRVDRWGMHVAIDIGAGAETNSLPDPTKEGQRLVINTRTDGGGSRVITADNAINVAGNTIMTFADVGEIIVLESAEISDVGTYRWRVIANDGVALS